MRHSLLLLLSPLALCAANGPLAQSARPAPAVQPILANSPGLGMPHLLGGWQGRWLTAQQIAAALKGGAVYSAQALNGNTRLVRGTAPVSFGVPCEQVYGVPLEKNVVISSLEVLFAPKLNVRPRPVVALSTLNSTYREATRQELVKLGLKNPNVRLIGVTRTDLDGNGTDEVIIEASSYADRHDDLLPPPVGKPGDYSVLLLRQLRGGVTVTSVLASHVAPRTEWKPAGNSAMPVASLYRLAGIADLNGDGRMELIIYDSYYEGHNFTVSEWTPDRGEQIRLSAGCGA